MALKLIQGLYSFTLIFITAICSKYFTDIGLESFYESLDIAAQTPQNSYFRYIWRALYFLLFLSFYIILISKKTINDFEDANALFVSQLFLQILWTFSFFYMEQLIASCIVIIMLLCVVLLMLHSFYKINKFSFWILIPYLVWLLFASYLNIYIAFAN